MNTLDTMLLIANTFIDLCKDTPLQKVSISDIVQRTGKNRKTFYYHFENKNSLINWIFRYDLNLELKANFPENELVFEEHGRDSTSQLPYYILHKVGVRSLDHSEFFTCFERVLENRRSFYVQALTDNDRGALRNYLYNLYVPALKRDIDIILANRFLPEENIQFLAEFYTSAFLSYFMRKCDQPSAKRFADEAGPFANIIHSSLEVQIKEVRQHWNI